MELHYLNTLTRNSNASSSCCENADTPMLPKTHFDSAHFNRNVALVSISQAIIYSYMLELQSAWLGEREIQPNLGSPTNRWARKIVNQSISCSVLSSKKSPHRNPMIHNEIDNTEFEAELKLVLLFVRKMSIAIGMIKQRRNTHTHPQGIMGPRSEPQSCPHLFNR